MKRPLAAALVCALLAAAASAATGHLIELRDHVRILSMDEPIFKGRMVAFHRYPDGAFVSVPAVEVLGIAATSVAPQKAASAEKARFLRGEAVLLGPTGEGQPQAKNRPEAKPPDPSGDDTDSNGTGYGYYGYPGCCTGPPPPSSHGLPPALVGPNGYPGTPMRPIGTNGYPILAPSPAPR